MSEEITPMKILEAKVSQSSDALSIMEKLLKGLNTFFSKEDLGQKTVITEINAIGMVEIDTTLKFLESYGIKDEIRAAVVEHRRINNKSVDGIGVHLMIDFVDAFSGKQEVKTAETPSEKIRRMA